MITLEAGKLYQLKYAKEWIIAEYVKEIAPHSYKYNELSFSTFKTGPDKVRHVPLSHQFKGIRRDRCYTVEARGMEVRPVTQEAIDTITRLKTEIAQLEADTKAKLKELREFCG